MKLHIINGCVQSGKTARLIQELHAVRKFGNTKIFVGSFIQNPTIKRFVDNNYLTHLGEFPNYEGRSEGNPYNPKVLLDYNIIILDNVHFADEKKLLKCLTTVANQCKKNDADVRDIWLAGVDRTWEGLNLGWHYKISNLEDRGSIYTRQSINVEWIETQGICKHTGRIAKYSLKIDENTFIPVCESVFNQMFTQI